MLGTSGMRDPTEMNEGFREAQAREVALQGWTPDMRADRGRALHLFERRYREAEEEFSIAQRQDPSVMSAYLNQTMFYVSSRGSRKH